MRIALVSLDQAWEDKASNSKRCSDYILSASEHKCDLAIFPEMTLTGFTMNSDKLGEDYRNSESIRLFSDLAKRSGVWIIFGLILLDEPQPKNAIIVISSEGKVICRYDKIHPFTYSDEDKHFSSGNTISAFDYNGVNIGLSICYDLRFPEIFRALAPGTEIIVNIANWPASRIEHWKVLLRARAIENQVYMIGVNRTGIDGKNLLYSESSGIIDPVGYDVMPFFSGDFLSIYDVDTSVVNQTRLKFPFLHDRRTDLYKSIL